MQLPPDEPAPGLGLGDKPAVDSGAAPDSLQFEHAEVEDASADGITCTACKRPICTMYYEVNGKMFCDRCREVLARSLQGGSRTLRFTRAFIFGVAAVIICSLIWGGFRWATGFNFGLIAVIVGLVVGGAVRVGSRRKGGLGYQLLAVLLTYLSITATDVPAVFTELSRQAAEEVEERPLLDHYDVTLESAGEKKIQVIKIVREHTGLGLKDAKDLVDHAPQIVKRGVSGDEAKKIQRELEIAGAVVTKKSTSQPAEQVGKSETASHAKLHKADSPDEKLTPGEVIISLLLAGFLCLALASAIPFLAFSPIHALIIGIALWEAWKINRRVQITINGPFAVGGTQPPFALTSSHV